METGDVLRRKIKALAFDQYGAIVDKQKGLAAVVTPFLKEKGWNGKPNSFVTWWRRTACFLSVVYRNKKSITLDMKSERGGVPIQDHARDGGQVGQALQTSE